MSAFAFARRGACVSVSIIALGASGALAQQAQSQSNSETQQAAPSVTEPAKDAATVKPSTAPTTSEATPPPGTSNLPELVVDGPSKKKEKKKAKAITPAASTTATTEATSAEPPPGVTLGTAAVGDTGTTTFDAANVQMRTTGGGDANSFARNLPNVQYQNSAARGGVSSSSVIDTKPQLLSISGGRTYENNFIVNGVSTTNIMGPVQTAPSPADTQQQPNSGGAITGASPQTVYVPAEFIGEATVIDSNASAEYGSFTGGVVKYDLVAPSTNRYIASVTASRESSDYAHYMIATIDGLNPNKRVAPTYEKTNLAASVGAPITSDFGFVAQVSRKEAESTKMAAVQLGGLTLNQDSENVFYRLAATARTDVGKVTLDYNHTDYFQHWVSYLSRNAYQDVNTSTSSSKLEYQGKLDGVRVDALGLGGVKLTARTYYNDYSNENNSGGNVLRSIYTQGPVRTTPPGVYHSASAVADWCPGVPGNTATAYFCFDGGFGDQAQAQTDYGAQVQLKGSVLLGTFNAGAELKQYEGRQARFDDYTYYGQVYIIDPVSGRVVSQSGSLQTIAPVGGFKCGTEGGCDTEQFASSYQLLKAYDAAAKLASMSTYAELDQTWNWFNVRGGVRLEYDDYLENLNLSPRVVGTVTPFQGVSVSAGYNRYYIGETLYYAVRDKVPQAIIYSRNYNRDTASPDFGTVLPGTPAIELPTQKYSVSGLDTPYSDEYTGALRVRDPLLDGQWRFKYLERYGEDQFATASCGDGCYIANNSGSKFYRSASAEYTKAWNGLSTPFFLNAAAFTGNVTWSEQKTSANTYLQNTDIDGDGLNDNVVYVKNKDGTYRYYSAAQFGALTGNLDIPVRFGGTLSTMWFDGALELNLNAGVNLGFNGYYNTGVLRSTNGSGYVYAEKQFNPTLKLDVSGRYNVNEYAAIDFHVDNITNSAQNTIGTPDNPWVLGRSVWVGSTLKLQ